jgi:hypothetical protein
MGWTSIVAVVDLKGYQASVLPVPTLILRADTSPSCHVVTALLKDIRTDQGIWVVCKGGAELPPSLAGW